MPNLKEYWKKRDFSKTPEPKGEVKNVKSKDTIFVVHDHYATRHHHDLRLEMDGVLKSWAIPKLIDPKSDKKVLAIQTEDHSYEYRNFKGVIPKGHYGAGKVDIFDNGTYELKEFDNKKITFELKGEKLKGVYCLIKFKSDSKDKNWLFFKKK